MKSKKWEENNPTQFIKYKEATPIETEIMAMDEIKYSTSAIKFSLKHSIKYFFRKKLKNKRGDHLLQH